MLQRLRGLTFYVLLYLVGANEAQFQTGWFIESMTTQILVVFAIRTRRQFFRSRPHPLVLGMALTAAAIAVAFPMLPFGHWFGFVQPPAKFFLYLALGTVAYLAIVEVVKGVFYRANANRL